MNRKFWRLAKFYMFLCHPCFVPKITWWSWFWWLERRVTVKQLILKIEFLLQCCQACELWPGLSKWLISQLRWECWVLNVHVSDNPNIAQSVKYQAWIFWLSQPANPGFHSWYPLQTSKNPFSHWFNLDYLLLAAFFSSPEASAGILTAFVC